MINIFKKIRKNSERGQAIILIAFAIVGLVAIVGLMVDGGILLIEYARLKRGIDAASIAAASQFRKDFAGANLEKAGQEFLKLNQSDADVTIFTCDYPGTSHDASLCAVNTGGVARKLARVTASRKVVFGFMRIVGINETVISATSVGEAASIDMVLVIDTSSSMAYDTTPGGPDTNDAADPVDPINHPGDNPEVCNPLLPFGNGRCEPLGQIIEVAVNFVQDRLLFYPYDRVALIASTEQNAGGNRNPVLLLPPGGSANKPFLDNRDDITGLANTEIQTAIRNLKVFQPVRCTDPRAQTSSLGGCLRFEPTYTAVGCERNDATNGPSTCGSSNIGGSLYMAGRQFDYARQESFWVAIALIGGPATATDPIPGKPNGFCPTTTWPPDGRGCRDFDTVSLNAGFNPLTFNWKTGVTRHNFTVDNTDPNNPVTIYPANYDTDDYARDAADYVTSRTGGQGATLYSICLGSLCRGTDPTRDDPYSGEHLGQYIAEHSGGDDANHGLYYFSNDATGLDQVFGDISNNIFTRISQ